jgi:hypothetical protein
MDGDFIKKLCILEIIAGMTVIVVAFLEIQSL